MQHLSDMVIKISGEKRPSYKSPLGSFGANPTPGGSTLGAGGPTPGGPTPGGPPLGGPPPGNCACTFAVLFYNQ